MLSYRGDVDNLLRRVERLERENDAMRQAVESTQRLQECRKNVNKMVVPSKLDTVVFEVKDLEDQIEDLQGVIETLIEDRDRYKDMYVQLERSTE